MLETEGSIKNVLGEFDRSLNMGKWEEIKNAKGECKRNCN